MSITYMVHSKGGIEEADAVREARAAVNRTVDG
jgi:hypothetical protein